MVVDIGLGALVRAAGRQAKYEDLVGREDRGRANGLNKMANYASTRGLRRLTMPQTLGGGTANSSASMDEANL